MFERFDVRRDDYDGPVLVTGAGGCIGSWCLALLVRAQVPVVAFDLRVDVRRPALLISEPELARVRWLSGDIADPEAVRRAVVDTGARAIVHLAALQVPFCRADPVAGARVNVVGTVNVFEAARAAGLRRLAYASSVAAYGALPNSGALPTLYGAYKYCNEQTAQVYWADWGVPSVGIRPGVVYGVGRDQGMTAKTTTAILAAAAGRPYTVPFRGPVSWLHAGEAASAFLRAVAAERTGAAVYDQNGVYAPVEEGLAVLRDLVPAARLEASGAPLAFPMHRPDDALEAAIGRYGRVPLAEGIGETLQAFRTLLAAGRISPEQIA